MRFCTSCGKEVEPGKKFCEYCGTPLEQSAPAQEAPVMAPAVPASPFSPPVTPAPPSGGSGKTRIIAGILVVLVVIAGVFFIGIPLLRGSPGTGSTLPQITTLLTQAPATLPDTFSPALTAGFVVTGTPVADQTYEERYMETYNQVYSVDKAFVGGQKEVFSQDLVTPPLYIKFNITPKMYYDERPVEIGTHNEHIANVSYPSPNAWLKVSVYDKDNGSLVEEKGFNKEYSITTQQEFMVRKPGNYLVEISGNDVTADVRILTGKS
jgi:hypothetical protein